jgi:hypothetical protein
MSASVALARCGPGTEIVGLHPISGGGDHHRPRPASGSPPTMNEHRDANQTAQPPVRTTVIGQSPSTSDGRWVSAGRPPTSTTSCSVPGVLRQVVPALSETSPSRACRLNHEGPQGMLPDRQVSRSQGHIEPTSDRRARPASPKAWSMPARPTTAGGPRPWRPRVKMASRSRSKRAECDSLDLGRPTPMQRPIRF